MTGPAVLPTGHDGRAHGALLDEMAVAARAHTLVPRWDPTRVSGTPDHGRGLLDAFALALHVLWTYDQAWADEAALSNARLPESVWRMLALVGYHPDPGSSAQGLQLLRAKDGVTAVIPPGFRVSAPALGELPAATYETTRAITVRAALNELAPFLPSAGPARGSPGALAEAVAALEAVQEVEVSVPGLRPFADTLAGRFAANRAASLAARNAARARQRAQQVADTLAQLRDAGAPDICGDSYDALCEKLCAITQESLSAPDGLGPLSESQELLAAQLRAMAQRRPQALAGLEQALARCDGEDDQRYSARLDQLTAFLDALVGGLLQEARDQVVRLRGSRALTVLDERYAAGVAARGVAAPGTDTLYLLPTPATVSGVPTTQTALLAPGDWLVLAEDPGPEAPPGTPRRYHEAVQVLRVRDELPPGLREPVTRLTVTPPLRRRYDLARTVVVGNVVPITHGVTTTDTVVWHRADGPVLTLAAAPVTWLRSVEPGVADGRAPQVEVEVAGRRWHRRTDLRDTGEADAAFAAEVDPQGRTRVRLGAGAAEGATVQVRYRTGLGSAGNRPAAGVTTIAAAHPGLLDTLNPLPIGGGTDPEPATLSRARANRGIHALDRAVSLADVASLAETAAGVRRARAFRDAVRRRDHVTVVAVGSAGRVLDDEELADLRAFLVQRMPPGATVRVLAHRVVGVRARVRLQVQPGADPLAAMDAVRRRLGATGDAPGDAPGLLHPERVELGADVRTSDVYGALAGIPGVVATHVESLRSADAGRLRPTVLTLPTPAASALAEPASALPGSIRGLAVTLPAGTDLPVVELRTQPASRSDGDRVVVPPDAVAVWASGAAGADGLEVAWEEVRRS